VKISRFIVSSLSATALALPLLGWVAPAAYARGISDQWYIGFGGTASWLQPDPDTPGLNVDEPVGGGGTVYIGKDLDSRSSLQLQAFAFGDASLDDGSVVSFNGADASLLYRFYDSRDNNLSPGGFGTSLYGRFALGFLDRETDVEIDPDSGVNFGVGGGFETYLSGNVAFRAEAFFHEVDVISASLGFVFRFGGIGGPNAGRLPGTLTGPGVPTSPTNTPSSPTVPETPRIVERPRVPVTPDLPTEPVTPSVPVVPTQPVAPPTTTSLTDADNDGVDDALDRCDSSTPGYPVRADGCALFDGVLSGIRFEQASTELEAGSEVQLDFLVDLLVNQFPNARIELHSHTDNEGDVRSQAILTRGRLRTVGTYLVNRGVSANRLVLRSFGGSRPLFDNVSQEGRDANNRIEVLERPR